MDILGLAESSGMLVILDARIGREEYRSVHGSLDALQRFANALLQSATVDIGDITRSSSNESTVAVVS
jgi:hypothetical protein